MHGLTWMEAVAGLCPGACGSVPDGSDVEPYRNWNVPPCKKAARLIATHRTAPGSFNPQPQARSGRTLLAICSDHILACGCGLNDGVRSRKNEANGGCSAARQLSDQLL